MYQIIEVLENTWKAYFTFCYLEEIGVCLSASMCRVNLYGCDFKIINQLLHPRSSKKESHRVCFPLIDILVARDIQNLTCI